MPDSGVLPVARQAPSAAVAKRPAGRRFSTLLRRILLVNLLPLALLLAALLYLDQYQNGLLGAEVTTLREQARIYAGALSEAAVHEDDAEKPRLNPEQARPLLRRLTEPTPSAQARLYAPDGQLIADSRVREGAGGAVTTEPLPPAADRGAVPNAIAHIYDRVLAWVPHTGEAPVLDSGPSAAGPEWQPDVREELRLTGVDQNREMPAYIRRTTDDRLLVTVSEPVVKNRQTVGIILLTREAREVDDSLFAVRISILALFALALGLTVMLSWYLSLTIARPLLRLAGAAEQIREGRGRAGTVPGSLRERSDEIGVLANALAEFGDRAVDAHGRDRTLRGRRRARDQEPADLDPQRHRDHPPDRGAGQAAPPAGDHRRGRGAARPADQRHQRRLADRRRAVAGGDRPGGRGADPGHARRDQRGDARGGRAAVAARPARGSLRRARGGGPGRAGVAQPDRQCAVVLAAERAHPPRGARGRRHGGDSASRTMGRAFPRPSSRTFSTVSTRSARRASISAIIPASACRSAGRSSRR